MDPLRTLKSGAELTITLASFKDSNALLKAIARELGSVSFDMDLGTVNLSDISGKDINTLKNAVFQLVQSDQVEAALLKCLERCLYQGQRITLDTFNTEHARGDYYVVAWEVMKANLGPFFENLDLKSLTQSPATSSGPKSASPSTMPG